MKKIISFALLLFTLFMCFPQGSVTSESASAKDTTKTYYTVYSDEAKTKVLFLKGDDISEGDKYLSHENDLYEIGNVDEKNKTAIAKFIKKEELPKLKYTKKVNADEPKASAATRKKVGIYHTHNDESYYTPDGVDSVYGKGGIHDVGKALSKNFNKLGVETIYREDLHLPHNSGAYTRSQVTASAILNQGVDAIFDIHRDSTSRKYYLTKVDGKEMSAVRMVIGAASANYEENKNFAYTIKSYADEVYPGLIKDIYIGKGNYNQQLSNRAMLFEFGCENIEKDYAIKASEYLAKTLDVVLYGSEGASSASLKDVDVNDNVAGLVSDKNAAGSNNTLWIVLGCVGGVILILSAVLIFSKKARYAVGRFFSEMFAGIFGKKKAQK